MKSALLTAFEYAFPGAKIATFTGKFLKGVASSTIISMNSEAFAVNPTNVEAVIDKLTLGQENFLDSLALFPEKYAAAEETHFQDAVWEIVDQGESSYSEGNDGLPQSAKKFLKKDGVLPPSKQTINKVREETLTQLITTIYKNTYTVTGMSVGEFGNFDEAMEAREIAQNIIYGEDR